ncbi:oxygen-independent coproporphyrinogen III oxidase [Filimonas effusa]|uniref:Coproporphyrinogen-III oxidase n=1 Tax=Filimonas effusa TaxID=2508721 RepID=A0A4Q1D4C8_9BACT|nr:oxygen-independent coproporphyrinogen III oxidase [Filimonas effusa]RXK83285.1 oxygen-independent coproporphyrinogen III oxidase [Filimonas effusa]
MTVPVSLLHKYNVPAPRYTSYPTVPFWKEMTAAGPWLQSFGQQFGEQNHTNGLSLYLHLPFCEVLCTYCGCNKKITTNHKVESPYIEALLKEWALYLEQINSKPIIRELHLGGGTPTFFSPENLRTLLQGILKDAIIHPEHDFSFEGHPNNTTEAHLQCLYDLGFRRVSYGVQDHDARVQRAINRIQPFENVKRVTEQARAIGYHSVNFDLIYGLPFQTLESIDHTIRQSIDLQPDRIAFYSYAHVPWTSKAQRLFTEADLPTAPMKLLLYQQGKNRLVEKGYRDIGMDHFSLPADDLYKAWEEGRLHRNFMGYTTQNSNILIGLGVSSISDTGVGYAQNEKTIHDYYARIEKNELPIFKGCELTTEDISFKKYIKETSCQGRTTFAAADLDLLRQYSFPELKLLAADGLVNWNEEKLEVTELGRHFIRNICRSFDLHLLRSQATPSNKPLFSQAI